MVAEAAADQMQRSSPLKYKEPSSKKQDAESVLKDVKHVSKGKRKKSKEFG